MKTNVNVKLNWSKWVDKEFPTNYFAMVGNYMANVSGKFYDIIDCSNCYEVIYQAKARSNADAFQRASNKLVKINNQLTDF